MRISAGVLSLSFLAVVAAGCSGGGGGSSDHAPVGVDDTASTTEDTAVSIDVLGNDTDADPTDVLAVTDITAPANGDAVVVAGAFL
jgi:hypothetical protein